MLKLEHMIKRFPASLLVWLLGAVACGAVFYLAKMNAALMPATGFVWIVTYVPYVIMVACTLGTALFTERSFAGLVWSIIFSLILGIGSMIIAGMWQAEPELVAALLINSPAGTEVKPITSDVFHVGVRFFMALLLPVMVASIMSWNDKRKVRNQAIANSKKKAKGYKSSKKSGK